MTQAEVLFETKTISLDVGTRIAIVGANDSGIGKFRIAGEDRYEFMNVAQAKQATTLHGRNFAFVIMNGRIPEDVQKHVEILADRAKAQAVYVTADGGAILKMMEKFPMRNKGVIICEVPQVVRIIELVPPSPKLEKTPPHAPPPSPPAPPAQDPPSTPQWETLSELTRRERFEQVYDQCTGNARAVIDYFRSLGFGEDKMTDTAIRQRCSTIKKRREKAGNNGRVRSVPVSAELLLSGKGKELLAAIERAKTAQDSMLELAAEVAAENEQLKQTVAQQNEQLAGLPSMEADLKTLRQKYEKAKEFLEQL